MRATQAALAMWARLSYTSLFERVRVIAGSSVGSIPYGALTAVQGAGAPSTITLPNATTAAVAPGAGLKECHDVGVLNVDGAFAITISAPDGKTINGAASLVLPADAGAFALCFYNVAGAAWFAITSPGSSAVFVPPPTYTALGPAAPQTFTNAAPVAVTGASITTAPFTASQKAIITYSAELHNATAGTQSIALCSIFNGVAATPIDSFRQDLDAGDVAENIEHEIVSWTVEVVGNGLARTFGLAIVAGDANNVVVDTNRCRGVVQIVDG